LEFVGKNKATEFAVSDLRIKSLKKAIFKQAAPSVVQPVAVNLPITDTTVTVPATPTAISN
jgi:hypothetical protein